jgi:polysaccharide chain length determinant protein (PEP-CTERM system associated)
VDELLKKVITEIRGAWRFRWWAMAAAWLAALVGWAVVFAMPNQFEAKARVYVDTDSAIRDFMQGMAVEVDVNTRVAYVRQQLLSRPHLEDVARETDLDLRANGPGEFEKLIENLRADIQIASGVPSNRRTRGPTFEENLYTISYRDGNRGTAEAVVRSLLNAFMDDSLSGSRTEPQSAQKFLEQQIALYSRRLNDAERKLAAFKREHVGMIPGESGDYFARLQAEIERRDALRSEMQIAQQRRDALVRQMQGTATGSGDVMTPRGEVEQKIGEYETRLDELLLSYTERHPDVISTRQTIEALRERLENMTDDVGALAASNPVYQQAQIALNDAEVEIAGLQSRIGVHDRRVSELQGMLETIPEVEAELQALTRDYEITKANYEELVQRLEQAKLSGAVGETGEDVAFRIIDPPLAPLAPVAPNRPMLLAAVLVAALGCGGALAYILHQLNPVFTSRHQIYEDLSVPVLGSVSMAWTPEQRRMHSLSHWSFGLGLTALVLVFGGVFLLQDMLLAAAQRLLV